MTAGVPVRLFPPNARFVNPDGTITLEGLKALTLVRERINDPFSGLTAANVATTASGGLSGLTVAAQLVELDTEKEATGTAAAAVAAHVGAADPHVQYAKEVDLAAIATSGSASDLSTGTIPNDRLDAELKAIALLTSTGNKLPYYTGSGTAALADFFPTHRIIDVRWYGAVGNGSTDDTTAIQNAINAAYEAGGGTVYLPPLIFAITTTLEIPQRVWLVGTGAGFVNPYVNNYAAPKGSVLFLTSGSNTDVLRIRCRLTNNAGILEETTLGGRNVDARHFGGIRNLTIWGNRSLTTTPNSVTLNSSGWGVSVEGARYVQLDGVVVSFCASGGVRTIGYNYGTGSISCNNLMWGQVTSSSNAGDGFSLTAADSSFSRLQSGFNAGDGFDLGLSNSQVSGSYAWNNWLNGFAYAGGTSSVGSTTIIGCRSYDNTENGFRLGACGQVQVVGCQAKTNGRDNGSGVTPADTERTNFHVSADAQGGELVGCQAIDESTYARYGFYVNNTTYEVMVDGCRSSGHVTSNFYVYDESKLRVHYSSGASLLPQHPGFTAAGTIDLNGNKLKGYSYVYPLMNWGGKNFNGTTTYLDGNALTGIADAKVGTFFAVVRFAGAASAIEYIINNTGAAFQVFRTSTGRIQVNAENAAGTIILTIRTTGAVAASAGTYAIMASWNLATAGTARIYVNDVSSCEEVTYTDDTIDYTVAEYSIGATSTGTTFLSGDIYALWFDPTQRLEWNTESVRRKFIDPNNVPVYLGACGQLPTGSPPGLFLAYDDTNSWHINRGSLQSTTFALNGADATATTVLYGQFAPLTDYGRAVTITADYTVNRTDRLVINNKGAACTLTLPSAASNQGRELRVLNVGGAFTTDSASSNVVPIAGGAAGTAILAATDGIGCLLKASGANWQIVDN